MKKVVSSGALDILKSLRLGFTATIQAVGGPVLSHKGTLMTFDDSHLIFADATSQALPQNADVVVEVMDYFSLKGQRFRGKAQVIPATDSATSYIAFYEERGMENVRARVKNFVLIDVHANEPVSLTAQFSEKKQRLRAGTYYPLNNFWKF